MAQRFYNDTNRQTTINDQVLKDNYEHELMKLRERERQFQAAQVKSYFVVFFFKYIYRFDFSSNYIEKVRSIFQMVMGCITMYNILKLIDNRLLNHCEL